MKKQRQWLGGLFSFMVYGLFQGIMIFLPNIMLFKIVKTLGAVILLIGLHFWTILLFMMFFSIFNPIAYRKSTVHARTVPACATQ